jgi:hypothetical protein
MKLLPYLRTLEGFGYVASPYSDPDLLTRQSRYRAACHFAQWCAIQKIVIVSPIVHWHSVAGWFNLPTDAAAWARQNDTLLADAARMFVLGIEGWNLSVSVKSEIEQHMARKRPLFFAEPAGDGFVLSEGLL